MVHKRVLSTDLMELITALYFYLHTPYGLRDINVWKMREIEHLQALIYKVLEEIQTRVDQLEKRVQVIEQKMQMIHKWSWTSSKNWAL